MELTDIPLSYFVAGFAAWAVSFVWFVRNPEWIGASALTFMFFLPWVVNTFLGGRYIPTGQIIVLFFFPALLVSLGMRRTYVNWNDLFLLGAYGATILVSVIMNDMSFWGNKGAIVPIVFALLIYLSVDQPKALHRLLFVYVVLILLNTTVAGLQRAGFEWAYPEGTAHRADYGGFDRGFGLAGNFTMASLYATMTIPIAVAMFIKSRRPLAWVFSFLLALVGIAGQVFSVSRSGILGTALGVFIVIKRGVTSRAVVVGATLTLLGVALIVSTPLMQRATQDLVQHVTVFIADDRAVDHSAASRPEWARMGLQEWLKRPVFGGGPQVVYRTHERDTHNTFVNIMASYGIVGFTLFMLILYRCYRHTLRAARAGYVVEGTALTGALVSSLPIAFFHSLDFVDLFWFVPALCLATARFPVPEKVPQTPRRSPATVPSYMWAR